MNNSITNVVIVGRSNVGKSTLFNTLLGKKEAITGHECGLTRDYQVAKCILYDIEFNLTDTAGYNTQKSEINLKINNAIENQLIKADIVFFVVDISENFTSEDEGCWRLIRKRAKNIILIANKAELKTTKYHEHQLSQFGLQDFLKITAVSKNAKESIYQIMKNKVCKIKRNTIDESENIIRISIVGQPNVGKSTLYNLLYGEDRVLTAPVSGTTRDSILSKINYKGYSFQLIDTAGLRKKSKLNYKIEMASAYYSRKEIRYANCVILVIDSLKNISTQDITLSNYIIQEGRSILLVLNKWDLIRNKSIKEEEILNKIEKIFFDAKGIKVLFISATDQNYRNKILNSVMALYKKWNKKINTAELNKWFPSIWKNTGNQKYAGSLKFKYISQKKIRPPTFTLYHNKNSKVPKAIKRYIMNKIRDKFELEGTPIRINLMSSKNPYIKKK